MTSEIIHDNSPNGELEFADPLRVLRNGRDQAFSKVSEFGSFFVNILAGIEAEVLSQKHRHEREVASLERRLALMTGNRDALSEQVDSLAGRLEHKAPNPETAEDLLKTQSKLTIAETDISRLDRELNALKVKYAVADEERNSALSRIEMLLEAGDAEELAREVAKLQGELVEARQTAQDAIDAAEGLVRDAEEKADRLIQEARANAADPQELAALRQRAETAESEVARLNGEASWVLDTATSDAAQKTVKTLHALALQNPSMTLAQSLQIIAVTLGVEAPEPIPVPEQQFPTPAPAPEPAPVSFEVPEPEAAPAPISYDLQEAPVFDLQPAPVFQEAPVAPEAAAEAPAPEAVPIPSFEAPAETAEVPAPQGVASDFFTAPPASVPVPEQSNGVPGPEFFIPAPEAVSPAPEPEKEERLSADFFATAAPAGTETKAA